MGVTQPATEDEDTEERFHCCTGRACQSEYSLGHLELEVGPEEIVRLPGTPNLAGSALTPINAIRHAADMLRCDWQEIWRNYSTIPAQFAKLSDGFEPGARAEFVEIKTCPGDRIESVRLYRH